MLNSTKSSLWLFFGSLFLFTFGLSPHELTQFETRFGFFAQEIYQHGVSFFPLLYGKPYPDYPATYPILIYLFSLIFGKVTLLSSIWPSAINAAGTVVLTYRLGALHRLSWGMAAVLFELATFYFLMTARSLSLDQFVLFATTLSFYLVYVNQVFPELNYRKWLPWVFLYGFIFRGPMGIVLPLSVVFVFYLLNKDYKNLIRITLIGITTLVITTALLLILAYYQGGSDFVWQVIGMQGISRFTDLGHYPFYFYFQEVWVQYAITFPLAVLVVITLFRNIFSKSANLEMKFLRYLVGWTAIILIGLSIPSGKKLRYILPIVPAISLISARIIVDNSSWVLAQIRSLLLAVCFFMPIFGLFLVCATEFFSLHKEMELGAHYVSAAICLVLIFGAGYYALKLWPAKIAKYNINLAMGVAAWLALVIFMIQPIHAYFNRTLPFAEQVQRYSLPGQKIIFYDIGPDGEDVKLMLALKCTEVPVFLANETELATSHEKGLVIARVQDYQKLSPEQKKRFPLLYNGKIGHLSAVILKKGQ